MIFTRIVSLLIVLIIISLLVFKTLYSYQYRLIYLPTRNIIWTPENSWEYEEIHIPVNFERDRTLNGFYFNNLSKDNKTLLFCHGSFGNVSYYEHLYNFCKKLGLNFLIFDYSGYGKSTGFSTQKSLLEDGDAIMEYLLTKTNVEDIILIGESLGGSVATHLARNNNVNKLILLSTFDSIDGIVKRSNETSWINNVLSIITQCVAHTLPIKEYIKDVKCPILIIHSKEDDKIPYSCAEHNYLSIEHPTKSFMTIKGRHSCPVFDSNNIEELINFMGYEANPELIRELKDIFNNNVTIKLFQ